MKNPADPEEDIYLVISKHWDNPMIKVAVSSKKIQIEMSAEDFVKALVAEIPSPTFTMSRPQLQKQCLSVLKPLLNKVKEATAKA